MDHENIDQGLVDFMNQMYSKRKRTVIPILTKIEILRKLESGVSSKHLAIEYGLGQSTIYDIFKNATKIVDYASRLEKSEQSSLSNISYIKKPKQLEEGSVGSLNKCLNITHGIINRPAGSGCRPTETVREERSVKLRCVDISPYRDTGRPSDPNRLERDCHLDNNRLQEDTCTDSSRNMLVEDSCIERSRPKFDSSNRLQGASDANQNRPRQHIAWNDGCCSPKSSNTRPSYRRPTINCSGSKYNGSYIGPGLQKQVPDLSDRIGMEPTSVASKTDVATSNYLTCSPLLSGMSGLHEDLMHGGAGPSSSHDAGEGDNSMQHEYEQEELVDVKAEPVYGGGSEICEDENSQNNTLSSGDRRSSQSSPTPTAMAGPYLLKKETHCTTILDQLLRDDTFSDVTLTAEGQSIRAHKIVLCLASAYFRQVLSRESSVQNVIVFRDIKFCELRNLINFIYTGEATVDASDLESFMKTAEMLEVNSLSDGQRSLPKNFFPKARDPEPETRAPRVGTSSKRAMNSGAGSPPAKSRRTSADVSPPSRSHKSPYHSSSASQETFVSGGIMGTPLPVIKTEPKAEEMIVEDDYQSRECDEESYGNHASSPTQASQHHHPTTLSNSPPPEEFSDHSLIDKTPPGKCPFCPGSPQVRKETALTKHLYLCHPDRSPYSCDDCARAFLKKGAYEAHKDDCR